jgi:hypothetical protein
MSWQVYSQKLVQKQLDGSEIKTIIISGNNIFKIHVSSQKTNIIDIKLEVEGENNEQIILQTLSKQDTLFIGSSYQPLFTPPDDKLNAHRQISIELTLSIPENLNLNLKSDIASVFIKGNYKNVVAELLNGSFFAQKFTSNLLVNTIKGDINVETDNVILDIHTKNGNSNQEKLNLGNKHIILNSINGNISVTKTQ